MSSSSGSAENGRFDDVDVGAVVDPVLSQHRAHRDINGAPLRIRRQDFSPELLHGPDGAIFQYPKSVCVIARGAVLNVSAITRRSSSFAFSIANGMPSGQLTRATNRITGAQSLSARLPRYRVSITLAAS